MNINLGDAARSRARHRCEYCRMPEVESGLPFSIDHIIARQHQGATILENLALACTFCNLHKGPNISGIDPETGQLCRLFNPRVDRWVDHFRWDGITIQGISAVGRTTAAVLQFNAEPQLAARRRLLRSGWLLRLDI